MDAIMSDPAADEPGVRPSGLATPVMIDEWDVDEWKALRGIIAVCLILLLIIATGIVFVMLNNWWSDEILGPGTYLTARQQTYSDLVQFSDIGYDGSGVLVCIVDSGIDLGHADLSHLQLVGWKDFINNRPSSYDDHGHGTMMAGLMVARGGLTGVATGVELLVAKALAKDGSGSDQAVADAIDWCAVQGADLISLSLGGAPGILPAAFGGDDAAAAASRAIDQGIFVIAAAGNDGEEEEDEDVDSPCSEENVICAGGVGIDGASWSGSSKGDNGGQLFPWPRFARQDPDKKPELVGPADGVPVIITSGSGAGGTSEAFYGIASGTSAATVYASSAIAILLEGREDLSRNGSAGGDSDTVELVKQWLMDTVKPQNGQQGHDEYYGYGLLQVQALLDEAGA